MGNVCCPSSVPEKDIESRYDIVYCFVNSKSGGGVGKSLLKLKLKRLEYTNGTIRVVDLLNRQDRSKSIKELSDIVQNKAKVCAICAGGDGTVKWILQLFARAKIQNVPLSIVPFGTGNDMSRSLGWGGSAPWGLVNTGLIRFRELCDEHRCATPIKADMWRVVVKLRSGGKVFTVGSDRKSELDKEKTSSQTIDENMINYFSIGIDAKISFDFARNRKSTQLLNKMEYGLQGAWKTFSPTPRLGDVCKATVDADGKRVEKLDPCAVAYIFHNIRSYGAGMDIWRDAYNRRHFPKQFGPQRVDDGLLELLTVRTAPQIPLGHMSKEAQAKSYYVDLSKAESLYMQIDGEPFYVEKPESVRLERASTVTLLRRQSLSYDGNVEIENTKTTKMNTSSSIDSVKMNDVKVDDADDESDNALEKKIEETMEEKVEEKESFVSGKA